MTANGPAIWGGCVTRSCPDRSVGGKHRASRMRGTGTPRQRGQKAVTVQGGYGALFAVPVQNLLSITRVGVQVLSEPRTYHRLQNLLGALAQCRDTMLNETSKLSRYTKHYCGQMRALTAVASAKAGVRVQQPLQSCLECRGKSKKCNNCVSRSFSVG